MAENTELMTVDNICNRVYAISGQQVMLDYDLAEIYGYEVKRLNEQVKRNITRFPEDFMFQLTREEKIELVANCDRFHTLKHSSQPPLVFTEQGVSMLSSILRSRRAVLVNIQIMRTFTKLREIIYSHKALAQEIALLEKKVGKHDHEIQVVIQAIQELIKASKQEASKPEPPKRRIGFQRD